MNAETLANDLLMNFGGVEKNSLNNVLQIESSHDNKSEAFTPSHYYDIDSFIEISKRSHHKFQTLSINIESINAKFNQLRTLVELLDQSNCYIDAFFIQETWLSDAQCDSKIIEQYLIPGYHTISLGHKCGRKGGLIIYLKDIYSYSLRDLYTPSSIWEGLFIDVTHKNSELLPNKYTLANVYRPRVTITLSPP